MSILLLDIGNSRLKWALVSALDAPLPAPQALAHAGDPGAALAALAADWRLARPRAVYLADVTAAVHGDAVDSAIAQGFGCEAQRAVSTAHCAGLVSAYAEPARLGVDRWLAMLALWCRYRAALVVASAGTALTLDVVDGAGQHQGGVIAPGLAAMIDATLGRTRFAVGAIDQPFNRGLGQDTESCVRQGALHAAAGLLDRLAGEADGHRVLCGGDAATLQPLLASPWQHEPDLVLAGLAAWARLAS